MHQKRRPNSWLVIAICWGICVLAMLRCGTVHAQITLDADFDHGSLDEANSSAVGSFVTLAGRDNFNPGDWKWIYFSANNVNGVQPTFQIDDNFASGDSNLNDHEMVYSYDQQTWFYFDNNARNASQNTFTFSNNSPFTQSEVFVAYGIPYPDGRVISHTASLATSPWVSPTLSGNSSLVIGQSPGGTDDLGRTIAARDMYGYKITDPNSAGPKTKIGLIAGVHANETIANFVLEGLVEFLLGDDLEAGLLRQYAEFYIYPMANPDGRVAGYNRSTVQNPLLDPNRFWESPNYGGLDDIKVVGDALLLDTAADVDYFIDFHSTVVGKDAHFAYINSAYQNDPFWLAVQQLEPTFVTNGASLIDLTGQKFGRDELNADFTMTFETQFIPGENIDRFREIGENFALAFEQTLRVFGDLNFDRQLNAQDWLLFIAGAETDLAGLTPIEAYAKGDLDGDGLNSILDFGLFQEAYIAEHGPGSFAALFEIPEPTGLGLLLSGLGVLATRRARFRRR